jgi:hypothetical protein
MSQPYSKLLAHAHSGTADTSFIVPASKVWVVRSIVVVFNASPAGARAAVVDLSTSSYLGYWLQSTVPQTIAVDLLQPVAAGAALDLSIIDPSGSTSIRVGGYELDA